MELEGGAQRRLLALLCPPAGMELVFASQDSMLFVQHHEVVHKVVLAVTVFKPREVTPEGGV